ncbi:hypothetical protein LCGC14_0376120 [marine sediment metagenome]|uniref:Uncharacterized protein n=1 Tax=marine sediment metagenome TaxID=412755 RepID=A0A0F9T9P8_9ZZZZ
MMTEQEKLKAQIEQNDTDQHKLKEERERLQGTLDKLRTPYYSIGDRFIGKWSEKWILSYQGSKRPSFVSMVCLRDGTRHHNAFSVMNTREITPEEFNAICDGHIFRRYWDIKKGLKND